MHTDTAGLTPGLCFALLWSSPPSDHSHPLPRGPRKGYNDLSVLTLQVNSHKPICAPFPPIRIQKSTAP